MKTNENFLVGPNGEIIRIVKVNKKEADLLLEKNFNNRRIKERSVKKYLREMKNQNWLFNGAPILIDTEGNLLDGQHRLKAVSISGISQSFLIIENVKKELIKTVDVGDRKTVADVVKMSGIEDAKLKSSVAKKVLAHLLGVSTKGISFSPEEIISEITESSRSIFYREMIDFAKDIVKRYNVFPMTIICSAYVILNHLGYSKGIIQDFFDQLSDKKKACQTVYHLRSKVKPDSDRKLSVEEREKVLIKSCNQFLKGNFNYCVYNVRNKSKLEFYELFK